MVRESDRWRPDDDDGRKDVRQAHDLTVAEDGPAAVEGAPSYPRRVSLDPRIVDWCVELARGRPRAARDRALVIGVSGPQGGGKTTLSRHIVGVVRAVGLRAVSVSIDDFYLTHAEQLAVAAAHPGDRCLEHRGYPGTHDVALGERVIHALATTRTGTITVPVYDKSAHGGRGDRAPEGAHARVDTPLDVVFVEGWMVGFERLDPSACPAMLRAANDCLPPYRRWYAYFDAFLHLIAEQTAFIVDYRIDAERARRAAGHDALSDADARDYIARFIPAYDAYVPPLIASPPTRRWLQATIGRAREVLSIRVA